MHVDRAVLGMLVSTNIAFSLTCTVGFRVTCTRNLICTINLSYTIFVAYIEFMRIASINLPEITFLEKLCVRGADKVTTK